MKDKPVILIVDDQPQNIELLEAYLAPQDYEIVTAANGEEALGKLSGNQIDLILLDIIMPGMDGFEVARRVRQDDMHRLLPIILITVLRETEDRVKGIEAGCDDFISRPVDKIELLARVRSLLKVKAYNDLMSNYQKELAAEVTGRTEELKQTLENLQQDIIERKRAEKALGASESRYRYLYESMMDAFVYVNIDGYVVEFNEVYRKMLGYEPEELRRLTYVDITPEKWHAIEAEIIEKQAMIRGYTDLYEKEYRGKDGTIIPIEIRAYLIRDDQGKPDGLWGIVRDITERKRAEEALKQSENKYHLLADNVHDVIFVLDMNLKYTYISPSVKILRGYGPEEVLKQSSIEQTLTPSSQDLAMRTFSEIMELEKSEHREIHLSRTLQLEMRRKDGTTVWTEVKFSFIRDENQRPMGILGLTRDITERRKAEAELQKTLDSLKKAVGATIQVMVSAVEMRDPYTSGHQLRVANLSCAIATEMGLPQEKINGIRMAGSIHDIGKLSIPAEILSKPTKLTNIEFSLIKEHSRIGYEMLKDVESPWPLAQIVYQHHERMDGFGYPRNLKGDEIIMEARIMAVADVVESMASHRPYRPALGIDIALEEIEKNRGILYDAAVADACLRLFREKGYKLIA